MQNGFAIIQGNDLDLLAESAFGWCERAPLAPLEDEFFLVQSNGMADWLRLRQASRAAGVSASVRFPLPSTFLWQMYRRVVARDAAAVDSTFDKASLQWRIWRLLPMRLDQPAFVRPRRFLANQDGKDTPDPQRRMELCRTVADLFDQYQLYRGEWLLAWERGEVDVKRAGALRLGADQAWQAALWRALLRDMPAAERERSRSHLHRQFMRRLAAGNPGTLPRRIFLFGINSLPEPLLQALYAMAPYCQILLMALNPCRELWDYADPRQAETPLSNPLLNDWGARGRDFLRMLHACEPTTELAVLAREVDAFVERTAKVGDGGRVPLAIQRQMLHNEPPPAVDARLPLPERPGLEFLPAWSRHREVEVLHDRLLTLFAADATLGYRDVVVMAPDVEAYAPHVDAVFGRYAIDDARHLTWSISDRRQMADSALYQAIAWLVGLPSARITQSEVFALLELPSVRRRFGFAEDDVELVQRWAGQTFTRWGLDGAHKATLLGMAATANPDETHTALQLNSWQAGLDQLLAGYCFGGAPMDAWEGVALDEVRGSDAEVLGHLASFIATLRNATDWLAGVHAPDAWGQRFERLLDGFFDARDDADRETIDAVRAALVGWLDHCRVAAFDDTLPLAQASAAWFDEVERQGVGQRLSFTGVTFCTLMPMRAVPFRHIFLLGMNDGEYPREQPAPDFDLMQYDYRPGDRDRRADDQYLLLEALLSVREGLHVSWIGRDLHSDALRHPSVLIQQLIDYVDAHWRGPDDATPAHLALTQVSPLAGFSRTYFERGGHPRTYAHEWRALHEPARRSTASCPRFAAPDSVSASDLAVLLRQPAEVFYHRRLRIPRCNDVETSDDDEPFELDNLQQWQIRSALLAVAGDADATRRTGEALERSGRLPAGPLAPRAVDHALREAARVHSRLEERIGSAAPQPDDECEVVVPVEGNHIVVSTRLAGCYLGGLGQHYLIRGTPSRLTEHGRWRLHQIAPAWIDHLLANAAGQATATYVIGLDTYAGFPPTDRDAATSRLAALLDCYLEALQGPLPVTSAAALAVLDNATRRDDKRKPAADAARRAFTGGPYHGGDLASFAVQRAFPTFESLWHDDGRRFLELAAMLYQPLLAALDATHAQADEDAPS
ncbi:MAG TPA: exodeoxyribonuclease V subunit gamma [Nevskiaceae bacterium]